MFIYSLSLQQVKFFYFEEYNFFSECKCTLLLSVLPHNGGGASSVASEQKEERRLQAKNKCMDGVSIYTLHF